MAGYEYAFDFLAAPVLQPAAEKTVSPLYEQLWHATDPSLAFVGLPWRVVPFPLFEAQADALTAVFCGKAHLPSRPQRERHAASAAPPQQGMPARFIHMLGDMQWSYCARLKALAGSAEPHQWREQIYNHVGSIRSSQPLEYREWQYQLDRTTGMWSAAAPDGVTASSGGGESPSL